ncbi:hypothetical protein Hanom_Chr04g00326401 [Helianthus anomalus]
MVLVSPNLSNRNVLTINKLCFLNANEIYPMLIFYSFNPFNFVCIPNSSTVDREEIH